MREDDPNRFVEELREPLAALPRYFGAEIRYDHRSRRLPFGPAVTLVRGSLVRLLRWWLLAALERQDRVNRLLVRALEQLDERSGHALDERLATIEETWRARDSAERAELLESTAIAQAFAAGDRFAGADSAPIVERMRSRGRVLVSDLSWPALAKGLADAGVAVEGIELGRSIDAHLRALSDASFDAAVLVGAPLQGTLGHVAVVLRQLRRVLADGAPLALVVPNADVLSVGARDLWRDPGVRRPVPPRLYAQIAELAGFHVDEVRTLRASRQRLSEDVADPQLAANMRVLNELLFGADICAIVARR